MSSMSTKTTKYVYKSSGGKGESHTTVEHHGSNVDHVALTRLEDKLRLCLEDLESERELRSRIEREKADLSVQVMQLSERVEESEGSAESQFEINKKRDMELLKLRKLLEDVHLESEEQTHLMKKNHQQTVVELQDQLDVANKHRGKIEKEKAKFQQEVYELLSQVEAANKDKITYQKASEKLEVEVHSLTLKHEELHRTVSDVTSIKARISQENIQLIKEVQELKVSIENISYLKQQLTSQLDDAKRRLEDDDRRRSMLESSLHTVEMELESVRVQLEEESEARLDLERQTQRINADCQTWKSKYESEAHARVEEIEELRRKYQARIGEQEEQIEGLMAKCAGLEKQKSRLQSEVEVLIIDLEKSNSTARDLQKRVDQLERLNGDLKSKLDELAALLEQAQRDNRAKQSEIQRLTHELDKTREAKDALTRDNKKLASDNVELKAQISDITRKYHELEVEVRRLENEREELSSAYKEAENGRKVEEQRAQRLGAELNQVRHEYEKRLNEKEEEVEIIRKQMTIEIEQLNAKLVEAETRLKTEVTRIKKKLQIQITELEMSLDVANKNNIELQKTVKKMSLQLTEMGGHYDEVQRQLQVTLDQLGVSQRRVQALQAELEEMRGNLDAAMRAKRSAEQSYEEAHTRVNELTTINVNLSAAKSKLEQEYGSISADYDEISKELRMADDRVQKTQVELKHTLDILHEEQERVVKIESIKKSLEIEVKNVSMRLEEVESNAIAGGKRIIGKLESRVRDLEMELDSEKRCHSETTKVLRKKERHVKELMLASDEDRSNVHILQEQIDKMSQKCNLYKRQLDEQESNSSGNLTRVRRFQRELEAAEERAETAESNLSLVRAKHRTFVTSSQVPGLSSSYSITETTTKETM